MTQPSEETPSSLLPLEELSKTALRKDWLDYLSRQPGRGLNLDSLPPQVEFLTHETQIDLDACDLLGFIELLPPEVVFNAIKGQLPGVLSIEEKELANQLTWDASIAQTQHLVERSNILSASYRRMLSSRYFAAGSGEGQLRGELWVLGAIRDLALARLIGNIGRIDAAKLHRQQVHLAKAWWRVVMTSSNRGDAVRKMWTELLGLVKSERELS